jgi:hypothetical protein
VIPIPIPIGAAVMPWDYIRMRREAAGLSIAQAARPFWHHGAHQADVERNFRRIETVGIRMKRLWSMTRAFPLSLTVYRQLCDTPADRHPRLCRACGWDEWTPQLDVEGFDCTWAQADPRICSSAPRPAAACSRRACPILTQTPDRGHQIAA